MCLIPKYLIDQKLSCYDNKTSTDYSGVDLNTQSVINIKYHEYLNKQPPNHFYHPLPCSFAICHGAMEQVPGGIVRTGRLASEVVRVV